MATPDQRIRDLERSELFGRDFPKRLHLTHAQWAVLSDEKRSRTHDASLAAIRSARKTQELEDIIREMGKAKQASAVPILARLWSDCALIPVRDAAGHALRAIGTPEARAALEALIDDAEPFSVFLAVRP
jgi:HEAT repeat protein